jgi:hypothetical protein
VLEDEGALFVLDASSEDETDADCAVEWEGVAPAVSEASEIVGLTELE